MDHPCNVQHNSQSATYIYLIRIDFLKLLAFSNQPWFTIAMDARLDELVHNTNSLVVLPDRRRIKCLYTMHEMPFNFEVVSQYLSCTKYGRACVDQLLEEHKDYIVDVSKSSEHPNQLFCELTWRYINKDVDHLICHLKGRKFQNALIRYNQCKAAGEDFIATSGKYKHPSYFNETSAHADANLGHKRKCTESDDLPDEQPVKRTKRNGRR
ncbi:hypothetical protein PHET_10372 [Paragonimus heterotremus]|uniref:Uncharacterized protein n=1 Tax=Paragonimus heterotremus TaxID=100268 RepID=A0A8J4WD26_9TREM|nr:hypothetical protein PHET_10372 [Paragonimus heterotremus]